MMQNHSQETKPVITVLGCGVSGLTSAILLLENGYPVQIWAKDLPPQTTSNVAAAIWYPYKVAPEGKVAEWGERSYARFCELAEVEGTGVKVLPGVEFLTEPTPDPVWSSYVRNYRRALPQELPKGYHDGYFFDSPVIDTGIYIAYLVGRVQELGGQITRREISSLSEAFQDSKLVINCTGLGSRSLVGDREVYPIRGQIIRVTRSRLKDFFVTASNYGTENYIIPRINDCILGGTADAGEWSLEPDKATAARIWEDCCQLVPEVAETEILEHLVGLRPARKEVRLEAEVLPDASVVIHNYGHGGAGVTISWGCAEQVLNLVKVFSPQELGVD
jgi:D-amino-acid oxidase